MRKRAIILMILSFYGFSSCNVMHQWVKRGEVLTLQPGSEEGIDAYIEDWPGDNYSNRNWGDYDAFAAVAWTAQGDGLTVRSLIKFDLQRIRTKRGIRKATLSLYSVSSAGIGKGHSTLSGSNEFMLVKVTSPWDEHKVTWNTQPGFTETGAIHLNATQWEGQDYLAIDVTEMVEEMIDHPKENYGMMIKLVREEYYRSVIFGSSDNKDRTKRPKLVIEF